MKKNLLFLVAFAALFSVFNVSCSSDDEDNTPLFKSKKIKEITLEYTKYGDINYYSAFLSYNAKNQLDNITYMNEKGKSYEITINYSNGIIYRNRKELCAFKLNNRGYFESLTPIMNNEYEEDEKRYFDYDENGYLVREKGLYNGKYYDRVRYRYSNGNLIEAACQLPLILDDKTVEYHTAHSLSFSYSDDLNNNNTPTILYSLGSYAMNLIRREYFKIIRWNSQSSEREELFIQVVLNYAGFFGKASKNVCRLCSEQYYDSGNWSSIYQAFFDDNNNITKIKNLGTNDSYSWTFVY